MRATLMKETLKDMHKILRPVVITGAPGGGKTQLVQQVAKELGVHYIQRHLPTMPVEDFGIPMIDRPQLYYKIPDWFPAVGSEWDDGRGGIVCFDDRNQADKDIQKVMANISEERELHGVKMADGWHIVSTGNRSTDRAGASKVLGHLANRETELELDTHLDDWRSWAIDNNVKTEVIAFIGFRPNLLHDYDPQRDGANPTPRSWVAGVGDVLGVLRPEAEFECFKGAIGEGAAAEFVGFMRIYRKLPNPDAILLNPDTSDVPTDPATLYALSGALAERASIKNMPKLCTYIKRMPPEFGVLSMSTAVRRDPDLCTSDAFTDWAVDNQDVLF